jgi:DnaK suppressor protein
MTMAKAKTDPKKVKDIEDKLRAEREDLLSQIAELEPRRAGEVTGDLDEEGEPESVTTERERDLSLLDNARALLDRVETALAKVDAGTYGTCESCGKRIEAARLKALPHAILCIACKRKEERY